MVKAVESILGTSRLSKKMISAGIGDREVKDGIAVNRAESHPSILRVSEVSRYPRRKEGTKRRTESCSY